MKASSKVTLLASMFVVSCGGSSSSPVPGDSDNHNVSEWCDQSYYQQLIGTYRGVVGFQVLDQVGTELSNCEWDTTLTISGTALTNKCFLNAQLKATPAQLLIPALSDPYVYQCLGDDNRNYSINDPNFTVIDRNTIAEIGFPVYLGQSGHDFDPAKGPYFGDDSVEANYVYLFAGDGSMFDQMLVTDEGYLDLIRSGSDFQTYNLVTRLNKVPQR